MKSRFSQVIGINPNLAKNWPKNEKIKNSFSHLLETIVLHPWSNFWNSNMMGGQVKSILVIYQKSPSERLTIENGYKCLLFQNG